MLKIQIQSSNIQSHRIQFKAISQNIVYFETTGSFWFYSKDEATNFNKNIRNTDDFKSFKYNTKLLGNTAAQPNPN